MKKGAIFDMDGLLFDTEKVYKRAWVESAEFFGKPNGVELSEKVSGSSDKYCRLTIKEFYPDVDVEEFFGHVVEIARSTFEKGVDLMEGVEEILKLFKENDVKTAVASSSPVWLIEQNLNSVHMKNYFDVIIGGDNKKIKRGKPAPDIFLVAAQAINLPPEDCYVFEDSYNGIRGATAAGCAPVMIPDTAPATDEMKKICTGIYPSLSAAAAAIRAGNL